MQDVRPWFIESHDDLYYILDYHFFLDQFTCTLHPILSDPSRSFLILPDPHHSFPILPDPSRSSLTLPDPSLPFLVLPDHSQSVPIPLDPS